MLGQFPAWLDVDRVSGVQRRVEDIGRVCAFAQRKLDRILLVRLSSAVVTLVEFERDMRLGEIEMMKWISCEGSTGLTA